MEKLILGGLPLPRLPLPVRYGLGVLLVTGLSALLALYSLLEPRARLAVDQASDGLTLLGFVLVGSVAAFLAAALGRALERAGQAERSKDLLLDEIDHRIRNDLGVIEMLLALERRQAASPEARTRLERVAGRIRALSEVYRSLGQRQSHSRVVQFGRLLRELAANFAAVHAGLRPIAFEVHAGDEEMLLSTHAVPLALIVNELVTNAVKHAFPEGQPGRITIIFRCEGARHVLVVRDDGVGMPAGMAGRPGGQGRSLVDQLVRRVGGELALDSADGVRATVTFSVDESRPIKVR